MITVVVVTHKKHASLTKTLTEVLSQLESDEIIVLDDGAYDWKSIPKDDRIFYCPVRHTNYRLSLLSNIGIQLAGGDIVVKLDGDTYPKPGFIEAIRQTKPGEVVLTSIDWLEGDKIRPDMRFDGEWFRKELAYSSSGDVNYPQLTWGSGIAMTKDDWLSVGGFDESLESWGDEESDLGWRCYYHGIIHRCITHTGIIHQWHPRTLRGVDEDRLGPRILNYRAGKFPPPLLDAKVKTIPNERIYRGLFAVGRTEKAKKVFYQRKPPNPAQWIWDGESREEFITLPDGSGSKCICHVGVNR